MVRDLRCFLFSGIPGSASRSESSFSSLTATEARKIMIKNYIAQIPKPKFNLGFGFPNPKLGFGHTLKYILGSDFRFKSSF